MLSPFPGMDPYLEDPAGWPDFHHSFLSEIRTQLAASVSPQFYVRVEERVYVTDAETDKGYAMLVPDVIVTTGRYRPVGQPVLPSGAVVKEPVILEEILDPEIHDAYLEVRDARSHTVVTAIELLSPANKVRGSRGREALLEKRKTLWRAGAHWMEIDLLRAGERDGRLAERGDYIVTLRRQGQVGVIVWDIDIRDPLPIVFVPLRPPFDDALLDLQRAFTTTYERAYYADSINYIRPIPAPRLKPTDENWVERTVQAWLDARETAE
jgi:hypothetical protein